MKPLSPSPGAYGADLSPPGRGDGVCGPQGEALRPEEMFSSGVAHADDLSPVGRGRERSERVRGAGADPLLLMLPGFALLAAVLASTSPAARAQAPEPKSLTIVVGSTPGGGYDVYARLLGRYISRHLPGQPGIIVQNLPGASSLKAVQYLDANAPKDGSAMAAFNPGVITESLLNAEKIRFKFSNVAFLGSITRDLRACYAWGATGIRSWNDLKKAKRFNLGAPAPGTSSFINAATLKNMFGIAVHQVTGYAGSAQQRLAIERGELDGDCGAWSSVPQDWVANGKVNALVKFTPLPIPGLVGDVPYAGDLAAGEEARSILDLLTAADALGRPYVVSRDGLLTGSPCCAPPSTRRLPMRSSSQMRKDWTFRSSVRSGERRRRPSSRRSMPRRLHWSHAPARSSADRCRLTTGRACGQGCGQRRLSTGPCARRHSK